MEVVRTADGSRTLYCPRHRQAMHSLAGAVTEARHVFVEGSGVADRLRARLPTAVLEVGFGTGLNFLVTLDVAVAARTPVYYTALDLTLPHADLLASLGHSSHLTSPGLGDELLAAVATWSSTPHEPVHAVTFGGGHELTLWLGDATRRQLPVNAFEAVYHDGFSPAANPELWSHNFLGGLANALKPGGRLASYTVSAAVRRALADHDLEVKKRAGPVGGKRHVLAADKPPVDAKPTAS